MSIQTLPVVQPLISSRAVHAYPLSILAADRTQRYKPRLFSNYIQLAGHPEQFAFDFYHAGQTGEVWHDMFHQQHYDKGWLAGQDFRIAGFLQDTIRGGSYVWLVIDQYYMQYRTSFSGATVVKPILVYGVNREKRTFLLCTVNKNGLFEQQQMAWTHLEQALARVQLPLEETTAVTVLRPKGAAGTAIEPQRIKAQLLDYLQSTDSYSVPEEASPRVSNLPVPRFPATERKISAVQRVSAEREGRVFGQAVGGLLAAHLEAVERRLTEVKLPYFQLWAEHKLLMQQRFAYLRECGYWDSSEYERGCADVVQQAENIRKLAMRYMWTKEVKFQQKALRQLDTLLRDEASCLRAAADRL